MTIVTIPKELMREKELVLVPRKQYEDLLRRLKKNNDQEKQLWQKSSKNNFLKSYNKRDAIYDKL